MVDRHLTEIDAASDETEKLLCVSVLVAEISQRSRNRSGPPATPRTLAGFDFVAEELKRRHLGLFGSHNPTWNSPAIGLWFARHPRRGQPDDIYETRKYSRWKGNMVSGRSYPVWNIREGAAGLPSTRALSSSTYDAAILEDGRVVFGAQRGGVFGGTAGGKRFPTGEPKQCGLSHRGLYEIACRLGVGYHGPTTLRT
jgi:hypothetical protein